ncbi:MAG: hypothetical protein LUD47_07580 [Clostridia bacterium]|nr:hypothetical protein [Clostridia bacterium]
MSKYDETKEYKVGGHSYFVKPFRAMTAVRLSADVLKIITPFFDGFVQGDNLSDLKNLDLSVIVDGLEKCLADTDGKQIEDALEKLLIRHDNIAVDYDGQTQYLTEEILDEWMAGDIENIFVLAFYVVKENYQGFFARFSTQSGKAKADK